MNKNIDLAYFKLYYSDFRVSRIFHSDVVITINVSGIDRSIVPKIYNFRDGHKFALDRKLIKKETFMEYYDEKANSFISKQFEITYTSNKLPQILRGRFIFDLMGNEWNCVFGECEIDRDENNYVRIESEGEGTKTKSVR